MKILLILMLMAWPVLAQSPEQIKADTPPAHSNKKDTQAKKTENPPKEQSQPIPPTVNVVASGKVEFVAQPPKGDGKKTTMIGKPK